ncbi:MAG: AAA family ATPase [Chitinophagaceae bacterium]|nr:AAA family ATPase [Chitinophagaceae bacterium]
MNIKDCFQAELSDDQNSVIKKIESFLASSTNCFLLKGYAGTGKTFLMQGLVKYFKSVGRNFTLMAPTGRAAMVIGNKTKTCAYTVHKSIYNLAELEDDDHTFKFRYKLNLNEDSVNTVYIIDESSMISDVYNADEFFLFGSGYLLKDLFSFVDFKYRTDAKIIFIGDNAQLPPVGMNFSPALDKEYLAKHYQITTGEFEMKQIQRQQEGSGILSIATQIRNCLETNEFNRFEINKFSDTSTLRSEDFDTIYFETVNNEISEKTIVITHSNKQAHDYNLAIRQRFFPNQIDVQGGDILINTKNNYNYVVDFYNGQFLKIVEVSQTPEPPKTIRFYKKGGEKAEATFIFRDIIAELIDVKGQKHQVNCKIIDNFLKSDLPRLTQNEQQALYVDFKNRHPTLKPRTKEFKEAIRADKYFNAMQVKYGYAITCHKAQGGEWENAFVNFQVYMRILTRGFFRWAYTGITRAKKNLFAINAQSYSPLSEYIVLPTATIAKAPSNQFYVPNDFSAREISMEFSLPFLKLKYVELTEKLKDQDIEISVSHLQWVERYSFTRNDKSVTIDLNYGGKGFTGGNKIINTSDQEFAQFVRQKITEPLIIEFAYNPPKEFQKELFDLLKEETIEEEIPITNILNENYCDRYFLHTDANCAYLDCIYNGKGIYSTFKPYSTKGEQDLKLQSLLKRLS